MKRDKPRPIPSSLNICIVSRRFPILGRAAVYGYLWPIAKSLVAKGHKVTVLALHSPLSQHKIERSGVTAYFLFEEVKTFLHLKPGEAIYQKFLQLHNQEPFHIVHAIDDTAFLIAKEKKRLKVPMVFDIQALRLGHLFSLVAFTKESIWHQISTGFKIAYLFMRNYFTRDLKTLRRSDSLFVTSPRQRLALERYYFYPDSKIHMIPYGIELSNEPLAEEETNALRLKLGLESDNEVVICFSDFQEFTELENLLIAFQTVAIKKPKTRLILIGEGPNLKRVEYEIFSLALGKFVSMVGPIKNQEVSLYISLSQVLVNLSSRTSGFEPSLLEAMAQKKVIIGSELSPIATIVEDGVHGFLLRPADTESLTHLLLDLFDDRLDSHEIGAQASELIARLFEMDTMVEKTVTAYQKTMVSSRLYSQAQPSGWLQRVRAWLFEFPHNA